VHLNNVRGTLLKFDIVRGGPASMPDWLHLDGAVSTETRLSSRFSHGNADASLDADFEASVAVMRLLCRSSSVAACAAAALPEQVC